VLKNEVKKIVKKYAEILADNGFVFSGIYLFGSYAKRLARADSDIDVAVIVKNLNNNNYWSKKTLLWRLASQADARIEPVLIDERDFKTNGTQIACEAKKDGERVV